MDPENPAVRVVALVAFVGLLAGATALAYGAIEAPGLEAQASPVIPNKTTAPGQTVSFPVVARSTAGETLTLALTATGEAGIEAAAPSTIEAPTGNGTGFWVEATVPEDAPTGTHEVRVNLAEGGSAKRVTLEVDVQKPGIVVERGDTARVKFVGRFPDGRVFGTNVGPVDQAIKGGSLPAHERYSAPNTEPIEVPTGDDASFIEGFREGVVGVGVGHSTTLTLGPEEAYGNESVRETVNRTETITRIIEQPRVFNLSRDRLAQEGVVNETSEEGDNITAGSGEQARVYQITFLNETRVELTFLVEEGDRRTHYQQWPRSSVAADVNETHVTYRVDPPYEPGEEFTWHDYWPNATTIQEMNDEEITLRHSPEEGLTYTKTVQRSPVEHTVLELREDEILVERENPAPLAGRTLVFDVDVVGIK